MCRLSLFTEIPDLSDGKTVKVLKNWEGDYNALSLIKMIEIRSRASTSQTPTNNADVVAIANKAKALVEKINADAGGAEVDMTD
jgi:hypothetical protein